MNSSLHATIMIADHGKTPTIPWHTMAERTISLSASGSNSFPKSVIWFSFLARYPSSISVRLAATNTPSDAILCPLRNRTTNTGTRISRIIVSTFGIVHTFVNSFRIFSFRFKGDCLFSFIRLLPSPWPVPQPDASP